MRTVRGELPDFGHELVMRGQLSLDLGEESTHGGSMPVNSKRRRHLHLPARLQRDVDEILGVSQPLLHLRVVGHR